MNEDQHGFALFICFFLFTCYFLRIFIFAFQITMCVYFFVFFVFFVFFNVLDTHRCFSFKEK